MATVPAPTELAAVLESGSEPFVWPLQDSPRAGAMVAAVEGLSVPPTEGALAGIPLGPKHEVLGVVCWPLPNPSTSYSSEPPTERDLPFLSLLRNHVRQALEHGSLATELRESTRQLEDQAARLTASLASMEQAQSRLAQASRLESIGRLAGGIAHDFNNFLNVVVVNSILLRDAIPLGSPLLEDLEPIIDVTERAQKLTRQLLLFARQRESRPADVPLGPTVDAFARMASRLIGEQIRLRVSHDPRVGCARVDPSRLEQVMMNLATNARDAMPDGGTLSLETRSPWAEELTRAGVMPGGARFVALVVTDTGAGMDDVTRARIFDPFFTTKELGRGTGLGLAIVHGIIEEARGHVLVDSEPGRGTRFVVLLREGAMTRPPPDTGTERSILVTDDEEPIRGSLRRALSRAGFRVLEARSSREALEIEASGARFDLLLTDVVMPGGSGPELAAELRRRRPHLPVVFTSGHTFDTLRENELGEGEVYVSKPFTPGQILSAIERALAGTESPAAG